MSDGTDMMHDSLFEWDDRDEDIHYSRHRTLSKSKNREDYGDHELRYMGSPPVTPVNNWEDES